jgi:hypothetical protein
MRVTYRLQKVKGKIYKKYGYFRKYIFYQGIKLLSGVIFQPFSTLY